MRWSDDVCDCTRTFSTDCSKEHGFTMVFDRFGTGLLFADQTVDITAGVVARFDAAYTGK